MQCSCGASKSRYSKGCKQCLYKRLRIVMRGNKNSVGSVKTEEEKKRLSEIRKGKPLSIEHRQKLRIAKIGHIPWNKGIPNPEGRGENCHLWKGGITAENDRIRTSIEYRLWREAVFSRDNFTCLECGIRGGSLHADHRKPFSLFPELRFAIDNGRTLCVNCHKNTPTYGFRVQSFKREDFITEQ